MEFKTTKRTHNLPSSFLFFVVKLNYIINPQFWELYLTGALGKGLTP